MLNMLRRGAERRRFSDALLAEIVTRAREPVFYEYLGVADTIDGRFDMLTLHAWLVLERLAAQRVQPLSQALVDGLFVQFDEALREQGTGDIGMGRRMADMADAFFGRLKAYGEAADEAALASALLRNVYRGAEARIEQANALAIYVGMARLHLTKADLAAGEFDFGPLPILQP